MLRGRVLEIATPRQLSRKRCPRARRPTCSHVRVVLVAQHVREDCGRLYRYTVQSMGTQDMSIAEPTISSIVVDKRSAQRLY